MQVEAISGQQGGDCFAKDRLAVTESLETSVLCWSWQSSVASRNSAKFGLVSGYLDRCYIFG
jgi:hypothetical protein